MKQAILFLLYMLPLMSIAQFDFQREAFYNAKKELSGILTGELPINYERAIFVMENAYWGNKIDYDAYEQRLDEHTMNIIQIIQANRDTNRIFKSDLRETAEQKRHQYEQLLVNWAIYQYMTDTTVFIVNEDTLEFHEPLRYTRQDPMGVNQWEHTQVLGLLDDRNSQGNCFALTSLFYIFSNRLNGEARINTAPGHIYISHQDDEDRTYNIDLPSQSFPGIGSIMTFTYTSNEALQNGISLRPLDKRQAIGLCLVYLAKGWQQRFGTDGKSFMLDCANLCLRYDSLNMNALLLKMQILEDFILTSGKGFPSLRQDTVFQQYEALIARLYNFGYREMPIDMKNLVVSILQRDSEAALLVKNHTPDLGKGIPFATLSGGRFEEIYGSKPNEKFGRAIFDTKQQCIVRFDRQDSLYNNYPIDMVLFGWSIDPMAHERVSWTPYNAMRDNPMNNIDPTGALDGWVEDQETGTYQYDPNINSQEDIDRLGGSSRFKYMGESFSSQTKRGTTDYRKDGSILFSNRTDGYNRIWSNSKTSLKNVRENREHLGFALKEGLLVLPDYKNNSTEALIDEYGYTLENGLLFDPVSQSNKPIEFSIHSHPNSDGDPNPSYADQQIAKFLQPNKPVLIISHDMSIWGVIGDSESSQLYFPRDFGFNVNDLLHGNNDFIFSIPK